MARTRPTGNIRPTGTYETSSGTNPGEDFEAPEDLSDIAGIDAEIPRGNARPTGSLLQPKPKPRSPIGLEVGKSAGGGLGVVVAIPIGGPISGRGGINLGAGGAIKGAQVGLGFGLGPIGASIDVGTDQNEAGEGGCYQYATFTVGPFSHTYGRNVCEPKPNLTPSESPSTPNDGSFKPGEVPPFDPKCLYCISVLCFGDAREFIQSTGYGSNNSSQGFSFKSERTFPAENGAFGERTKHRWRDYYVYEIISVPAPIGKVEIRGLGGSRPVIEGDLIMGAGPWFKDDAPRLGTNVTIPGAAYYSDYWTSVYGLNAAQAAVFSATFMNEWPMNGYSSYRIKIDKKCPGDSDFLPVVPNNLFLFSPPSSPPIPNPPPRKKMNDDCCKKSLILQAEILRLLGRELGPEGLVPQTKKAGFIGEEIERTETPIVDPAKPKKIKVRFETVYDLLKYALKQANNLDTALDPQSYKLPTGKIQNPAYNRDSEQSLKSNSQPRKDKSGNKRELEINKDDEVKMGGFLQQQQYIFDALRRLEYLFPSGELSDALIAKSLLIPGAKGDIKIHNMIMAYEIQMQYLDAALGNPREKLVIKDANPAIEGDQPIEVTSLSISDLLRQNIKFHIDTGGDVDALVNLVLRDFRTNLANRIDLIKSAEMVQALFEDSGMLEKQEYIDVHLEGDVYAGQWIKGQGFKPNPNLEKKTEEATEEVLRATMKPVDQKIKVSRRHKDEKTDMRDLLRGLADFIQRLVSIPSAGDAGKAIDKLVESAKFKVQTDMALLRQNVSQAAAASRNRTKKRKK